MEDKEEKIEGFENIFDGSMFEPETAGGQLALWSQSGDDLEAPEDVAEKLTLKAKKNICILSRQLWMDDKAITAEGVRELWPVRTPNTKSNDVIILLKAGPRPNQYRIEQFMQTEEFLEMMNELEVPLTADSQGLTPRQITVLTTLASYSDGKTLKQKLAYHKVSDFTFQGWMKQKHFAEAYKRIGDKAIPEIAATAKIQLANNIASGDLNSIKLGLAMSGDWDPDNKKQIDAQKVVALILDVIDRRVKDPDIRAAIGSDLQIISGKALEM